MHLRITALALVLLASFPAKADLVDYVDQFGDQLTSLEIQSAIANQSIYNELLALGCPDSSLDSTSVDCDNALTQRVWENVRHLVHTARDLTCAVPGTCGSDEFSLGVNEEVLGFALRWAASEEYSGLENAADAFLSGQLTSVKTRAEAIRSGATGFAINGMQGYQNDEWLAYQHEYTGLSSGDNTQLWSRWGGFMNITYSEGDHAPTEREVAYDSDTKGINLGFDYRVDNEWVVGLTLGYQRHRIDFDESQSVVSGGIDMDGYSLIPFALYQNDKWFVLASLGYQYSDYETERVITYSSSNNDVPAVNTTAISDNKSHSYTYSLLGGHQWRPAPWVTIEPQIGLNYAYTSIDEFSEEDLKNEGFNFDIEEQTYTSLETIAGLKASFMITGNWGVVAPYIEYLHYTEQRNEDRKIRGVYGDASESLGSATKFTIKVDPSEKVYYVYSFGLTSVLRGAQQKNADGPAAGGISIYAVASIVDGISESDQWTATLGLRYEF